MLKSRIPQIVASLNPRVGHALELGAELMETSAKGRVHVLSGDLRDAIHIEQRGQTKYEVVAGGGPDKVFYGHMEEYGTSHSAPHPFMVPAFEEHKDTTIAFVAEAIATL